MSAFDREKAAQELQRRGYNRSAVQNSALLDALAGCVTDEPQAAAEDLLHELGYVNSTDHVTGSVRWYSTTDEPRTIDRDALALAVHLLSTQNASEQETADRILALLRPDERIAKFEALSRDMESAEDGARVRAILRGKS